MTRCTFFGKWIGVGVLALAVVGLLACANSEQHIARDRNIVVLPLAPYEDGVEAYHLGDFSTALRIWQPLADGGDVRALTSAGLMYQTGRGIERDPVVAAQYYSRAANMGFPAAQNSLAVLYESGLGVRRDLIQAVALFRLAAEQDYIPAIYNLGRVYQYGVGIERDFGEAVKWFKRAEALQRGSKGHGKK